MINITSSASNLREEDLEPIETQQEIAAQYNKLELAEAQSRITENVKVSVKAKNVNEVNNIMNCLRNNFLFYNLSEAEIQSVKNKMYYTEVTDGQILYNQNDKGTCFFIVQQGSLELIGEQVQKKKKLIPYDSFGQLALLYNTERKSRVVALENSALWVIDRISFRQAVEDMIIREFTQNKKCLESVRFFSYITSHQKDLIASSVFKQKFYKGQTIIQEGDPGSTFYFLKEGSASAYKANKFQRKISKGDSFGQQSLYYNTMRQYTIKADEDTTCLVLGRDTLNKIMGDNVYDVTFKNFIRRAFEKNPSISMTSKQTQESIISEMKISSYKAQQSIFKRGIIGFQKLVVVIEGSLKKVKQGTIVATKGQCYGEQFLNYPDKRLDDEIVMQNYGVIAQISDQAFNEAVKHQSYKNLTTKRYIQEEDILSRIPQSYQLKELIKKTPAKQLFVGDQLSIKGQFGPLYRINGGKYRYLLKLIDKAMLEKYDVVKFASQQVAALQQISFPFIIHLCKKFQTPNYIGYVTEYVEGQDLYEILKQIGLLSTEDSQFYTASIILILEYFYRKSIICRDIKPQNFMVDKEGYLKLINLPTAKKMDKDLQGNIKKTYTIIGTPHYMAPDIVIGKGYNNLVDLWSLGVCLYEFLCGVLPFGDSSQNAYEIYQEIMQVQLKFPEFLQDKKAKKLIEQLLSHNPNQRHGGSFESLKKNPWFDNFNWNSLLMKKSSQIKPPSIPIVIQKYEKIVNKSVGELLYSLDPSSDRRMQGEQDSKWANFDEVIYQEK